MKRRISKPDWKTEAEMCATIIDGFRAAGWKVYPETLGFDLILVSPEGERYGVEAKLRPNMQVLSQASRPLHRQPVHFRVAAVPFYTQEFKDVADRLKVAVLDCNGPYYGQHPLPWRLHCALGHSKDKRRWTTHCDGELPELVIEAPAGVPSPKQLTRWKLDAVQFCLDNVGKTLTRESFVRAKLSISIWLSRGWITKTGEALNEKKRRVSTYELANVDGRPDRAYPEVVAALRGAP